MQLANLLERQISPMCRFNAFAKFWCVPGLGKVVGLSKNVSKLESNPSVTCAHIKEFDGIPEMRDATIGSHNKAAHTKNERISALKESN